MRVLKYFQLRRDLICIVLNVLGWDNDSLLFLFVRDVEIMHSQRGAVELNAGVGDEIQ